jgi:hypothetical protein
MTNAFTSVLRTVAILAALLPGLNELAAAATASSTRAQARSELPAPAASAASKLRKFSLSFKQLGGGRAITLRGTEGISGVTFDIRADEVVVGAKLNLVYTYSPALLSETSHLVVMLNDETATTLALPKGQGSTAQQRDIVLDPRTVSEFNRLNIKLIGQYTTQCEDPAHSSLWASISDLSTIEITVAPIAQTNDLALLPAPLFDRRDARRMVLPFVFSANPALSTLEAGGTLASWFGALSSYRGAEFPALLNALPEKGHAVVFATQKDAPAGIVLPTIAGPSISLIDNPKDPHGKLLLVLGRDAAELKQAARALALNSRAMSGATTLVTDLPALLPRVAYDAPNWIVSDHPVPLGSLASADDMTVNGYNPGLVRVNLRMAPDLFGWRSKGVPLDLNYRYTPRPVPDKSTLSVGVNERFVASIRLPAVVQPSALPWLERLWPATRSADMQRIKLPVEALSPNSQLQFRYQYEYLKEGACQDAIIQNVSGTIDADSALDLSALPHFIAMPDLTAFANSGFPFTRMADLSETAVVLPSTPTAVHVSTYLGLMGRMGESTGYPATGVVLAQPAQVSALADKDLLVIGSERDQPLLGLWQRFLPISVAGQDERLRHSAPQDGAVRVWRTLFNERAAANTLQVGLRQDSPGALLMGLESPLRSGRSVVVFRAGNEKEYGSLLNAMLEPKLLGEIRGSVVALRNDRVLMVADDKSYDLGRLPPLMFLHWWLSSSPLVLVMLAGISAALIGLLGFFALRRRAAARLG